MGVFFGAKVKIFTYVSVAPNYNLKKVFDAIGWIEEQVSDDVDFGFAIYPDDEVAESEVRVVLAGGELSYDFWNMPEIEHQTPVNNI